MERELVMTNNKLEKVLSTYKDKLEGADTSYDRMVIGTEEYGILVDNAAQSAKQAIAADLLEIVGELHATRQHIATDSSNSRTGVPGIPIYMELIDKAKLEAKIKEYTGSSDE
jgi:hypothetical protein